MFDPSDPNNGVGSNGSPNSQHVPLSPSAQYLASLLASTDPAMDPDLIDFIDFLALRRSQSRSVGSGNSPRQTGNQPPRPPSTNSQPQSAIPNRHPLSPIAVNNLRPPPPPNQRSTEDVTTQKVQSSPARTPRFSTSQWDSHRAKIKELFMDNDKSLDDTMKFMEENFSFAPSRKQYNTKLKQWGFIKNISGTTANWMVNKAKTRKRQGLETEFLVGGQSWTMERIERSAKRARLEGGVQAETLDVTTPPEVSYSTPGKDPFIPLRTGRASSARWSPSQNHQAAKPALFHLKWDGKTKADLEFIYEKAQGFARMGNFHEAENGYLQTLRGYEVLLSPTHEDTIEVAYELAEFYARNDRMNDADNVIEWMGDKHLERWPVGHKKMRMHLIRVADMLHSWSRVDDAVSVISQAANMLEKSFQLPPADPEIIQYLQENSHPHPMRDERPKPVHFAAADPPRQEDEDTSTQMDYALILAMARARAEGDEAEACLLSLLDQFEKQPEKLSVQILEARGALAELYKLLDKPDSFDEALNQIGKSFWGVFKSEVKKTRLLFETAIDVVGLLVKAQRYDDTEPMLAKIELDAVQTFGDDDEATICILIEIGKMFQAEKRWDYARPRFEQALAASMSAYGVESTMTKRLEDVLEKKTYVMPIPRFEEVRQLKRVVMTKSHCLGHELGYGNTGLFLGALLFHSWY